jgi:signal transduction histidine kinase
LLLAQQEQQRQEELRLVELGSLAAAMAHELRNPLNIISMASAQCEDKVKGHIQDQLKRADTLIQDLLSYARVMELNCQQIPLLPLIKTLANNITEQFNVPVKISGDEHICIWADPYKLQQVLVNCLENAGSFCQNQDNAKILLECVSAPNGINITIHNNGPTIAKPLQQELFKPFISKRPGGSGLGLAIVQRIMQAHNGSISFSEQLGWNVSFICHFPNKPRSEP